MFNKNSVYFVLKHIYHPISSDRYQFVLVCCRKGYHPKYFFFVCCEQCGLCQRIVSARLLGSCLFKRGKICFGCIILLRINTRLAWNADAFRRMGEIWHINARHDMCRFRSQSRKCQTKVNEMLIYSGTMALRLCLSASDNFLVAVHFSAKNPHRIVSAGRKSAIAQ